MTEIKTRNHQRDFEQTDLRRQYAVTRPGVCTEFHHYGPADCKRGLHGFWIIGLMAVGTVVGVLAVAL